MVRFWRCAWGLWDGCSGHVQTALDDTHHDVVGEERFCSYKCDGNDLPFSSPGLLQRHPRCHDSFTSQCDEHLPQPRLFVHSLQRRHSTPRRSPKGTGVGCLQRTTQNRCLFHRRVLQGVQWCVSVRLVPECVLNGWLLLRPSPSSGMDNHCGVIGARCFGTRFRGLYALQERGGW